MTTREYGGVRLERVREHVWEIPREGGMTVPARVFASEPLLEAIGEDDTLQQLRNATHLPGMVEPAGTKATAFRSAVSVRSTPRLGVSRRERSDTT